MTREQYLGYHQRACDKMVMITAAKNADYTGGNDADYAFANFSEVETLSISSTEVGFLTRMSDKFARIRAFVKKGVLLVKDESVEDTLLDLANYCILMAGYITHKKDQAKLATMRMQAPPPPQKLAAIDVNQVELPLSESPTARYERERKL